MCQHPLLWKLSQKFVKYAYMYSTVRLSDEDELLLNFASEADPPMGLQSEAADERNRGCIQLYHATASQVDLAGKKCPRPAAVTPAVFPTSSASFLRGTIREGAPVFGSRHYQGLKREPLPTEFTYSSRTKAASRPIQIWNALQANTYEG
jgi:hypothetical protein